MFNLSTSNLKKYPDGKSVLRLSVPGDYGSSFILYAGNCSLVIGPDPADLDRIYIKRLVEVKENSWAIEETRMNLPKQTMHQALFNCYMDPLFFYTNREKRIRIEYERPDIVNGASMWITPKEDMEKGFTAIINSFNYEQPGSTTRWFNWISSKLTSRDYYYFLKQKLSII